MEQIEFPQDFSGFLKLPNAHHVKYLLIGVSLLRFTDNPVPPLIWTFGRAESCQRRADCLLPPIDRSSQGPRNSQYGGQRPCHKQFDPA
jgi:hypothetical protein